MSWYINDQKADSNLLQPFQESTLDAYGFKLYQRSLEIRFRIDKRGSPFITDGKVHMRCVAQIRQLPSQIRESNHNFFVSSWDDLRNQKLINWKGNSGESIFHFPFIHYLRSLAPLMAAAIIAIIVFMLITRRYCRKFTTAGKGESSIAATHTLTSLCYDENNHNDDDKKMLFYIGN
jgi:hypothetical protein